MRYPQGAPNMTSGNIWSGNGPSPPIEEEEGGGHYNNVNHSSRIPVMRVPSSRKSSSTNSSSARSSDGRNTQRERGRLSTRQQRQQQQQRNRPCILTLTIFLFLTLATQVLLVTYHDDLMHYKLQQHRYQSSSHEGSEDEFNAAAAAADEPQRQNDDNNGHQRREADPLDYEITELQEDGVSNGNNNKLLLLYANYSMDPLDILARADIDHTAGFIPSITGREVRLAKRLGKMESLKRRADLPTVDEIQGMYGSHSHIVGLDTCNAYKANVIPEMRVMGPAGLFNSATNLLFKLMSLNCINTDRVRAAAKASFRERAVFRQGKHGIMTQAPWGKHNPVSWRLNHEAKYMASIKQTDFLPIVMIKDPITWMASMCRHQYESRWVHTPKHCPNLVPNRFDRRYIDPTTQKVMYRTPGKGTIELWVKFATQHGHDAPYPDPQNKTFIHYTSLVDMWNTWYGDWYDAKFPRLMVRFEDLLFHAEDVVSKVCKCGGGTMAKTFRYVEDSAKGETGPHAGSAGFLASLVTYGNSTLRNMATLTERADVEYFREYIDKDLMETFGYANI